MTDWRDPWEWIELRRVQRDLRIASSFMTIAIAGSVPIAWILLMPMDPTLRPDLTTTVAWFCASACVVLGLYGHDLARRARARFDQAVYGLTRGARNAGTAKDIPLEVDIGEVYPPVLVSRQHRMIGIGGPTALLIPMDDVRTLTVEEGNKDEVGFMRHPHLVLHMSVTEPNRIAVIPGRGLSRVSVDQVKTLRDRLNEFLEPASAWDQSTIKTIDLAAFVDSMRVRP